MDRQTTYEVLQALVGKIYPIGGTEYDAEAYRNLKELSEVVDAAVQDIAQIAVMGDRPEASVKKAARFASKFLEELEIVPADEASIKELRKELEAERARHKDTLEALNGIIEMIKVDQLVPESVSYMAEGIRVLKLYRK